MLYAYVGQYVVLEHKDATRVLCSDEDITQAYKKADELGIEFPIVFYVDAEEMIFVTDQESLNDRKRYEDHRGKRILISPTRDMKIKAIKEGKHYYTPESKAGIHGIDSTIKSK